MKCVDVEKAWRRRMAMKMDDLAEEKSFLGGRQILKCSDSSDKFRW